MKYALPLSVFVIVGAFLIAGLGRDPHAIPSPLIGQPAPAFTLPLLHEPGESFEPARLRGKVWLLNVWASWCVSCRAEHEVLSALSRSGVVPVYGLTYNDSRGRALAFLESLGNPYVLSVLDADGRVGIDYGVYGVPETYVIDKAGVIRFKQVGAITGDVVDNTIVPLVRTLNR